MEYNEVRQQVLDDFEFWRMNLVQRVQASSDSVDKALREVLAEAMLGGSVTELKALRAKFDQRIQQLASGS